MAEKAPLKYIDIQGMMDAGIRKATPDSLAFLLSNQTRGIPDVPAGFDQRRLPFADVSPLLRDQRQHQLLYPPQNNPFSASLAETLLNRRANTRY